MFLMILMYFYEVQHVFRILREEHEYEWKRLGSPTSILRNTIQNQRNLQKFIKKKHYLELKNSVLTKRCERVIRYLRFYLLAFGMVCILMIYTFVSAGTGRIEV